MCLRFWASLEAGVVSESSGSESGEGRSYEDQIAGPIVVVGSQGGESP